MDFIEKNKKDWLEEETCQRRHCTMWRRDMKEIDESVTYA